MVPLLSESGTRHPDVTDEPVFLLPLNFQAHGYLYVETVLVCAEEQIRRLMHVMRGRGTIIYNTPARI